MSICHIADGPLQCGEPATARFAVDGGEAGVQEFHECEAHAQEHLNYLSWEGYRFWMLQPKGRMAQGGQRYGEVQPHA